jgi:hypothetical protein
LFAELWPTSFNLSVLIVSQASLLKRTSNQNPKAIGKDEPRSARPLAVFTQTNCGGPRASEASISGVADRSTAKVWRRKHCDTRGRRVDFFWEWQQRVNN